MYLRGDSPNLKTICEASLQNTKNIAQNEILVILDYYIISLNKQQQL